MISEATQTNAILALAGGILIASPYRSLANPQKWLAPAALSVILLLAKTWTDQVTKNVPEPYLVGL